MEKKDKNFKDKYLDLKNYLFYIALFVFISIFSLYYINKIYSQGTNLNIFFSFPLKIIISILGLLFLYYIFDALRLYFVLKTLKVEISFWSIYKLVFIKIFFSNITPLVTGGGILEVYFLQKRGIPSGKSSAAVFIRTLLSLSMLFISVLFIIFENQSILNLFSVNYVVIYVLLFLVLYVFIFYFLIFKIRFIMKMIYKIFYFLKSKHLLNKKRFRKIIRYLFRNLELFSKDLSHFIQGKKIFIFLSFFLTIIFLISEFSFSYLIIQGLGYKQVSLFQVLTLQILVVFIMYFAPTPGAAGFAEGGYSFLFANLVDQKDLFPLIFYWRLFSKYIGIFIGFFLFIFLIIKKQN